MDLHIALPARYWHDILDALDLAADIREQTSIGCRPCAQRLDSGRGPCPAHLDAVVEAEQLHWIQRQLLDRLAAADPVTFAPAVTA